MKTLLGIIFGFLAISGAPLFLVISAAALVSLYLLGINLSLVIIEMYRLAANPLLIALVYFSFAGYLLAEGTAGRRLVRLSTAIFGYLPGGLAIVCLVSCAFFTAITGASGVTYSMRLLEVLIAAGCVVGAGMKVPADSFVVGVPGQVKGKASAHEPFWIQGGAVNYGKLARRYKQQGL